jgi:hypothetical protein
MQSRRAQLAESEQPLSSTGSASLVASQVVQVAGGNFSNLNFSLTSN